MISEQFLAELGTTGSYRRDDPLSRHTTFGVGGPADVYLPVATEEQLRAALRIARSHRVPVFILGSGSNVLVGDGGIRGLVIENQLHAVEGPQPNGKGLLVRAQTGVSFAALARRLSFAGYAGLEWASGIPGTLGGAVVYNAGAYGGCLLDVLVRVRLVDQSDSVIEMKPEELALGYRGSVFTRGIVGDRAVLSVDLRVHEGDAVYLRQRVRELDKRRTSAQPKGRNAGSMFKNPVERPAWWLIDQVGLRGHRIGDAQISEQHTNFFLNLGKARAADVKALMDRARDRVRERFGIELEPEVALVGEGF
ncbi:MAG: UDP-N-acetylmuramate dehydrogenase [Chloroflexi bacterium]|nr:UDP-N-acetylmuramate dehydrogenase [Chloroflexota bacterium]